MMRIYLKHLCRGTQRKEAKDGASSKDAVHANGNVNAAPASSVSPSTPPSPSVDPFLLSLQCDFNHGESLDLRPYSSSLSSLQLMGFSYHDSLEALLVTENQGVEAACEILLSYHDMPEVRREKRRKAAEKGGRMATQEVRDRVMQQAAGGGEVQAADSAASSSAATSASDTSQSLLSLHAELSLLRQQLIKERALRSSQQVAPPPHPPSAVAPVQLPPSIKRLMPLKLYVDTLSAMLIKGYILPREVKMLDAYRARNGMNDEAHAHCLVAAGLGAGSGAVVVANGEDASTNPLLAAASCLADSPSPAVPVGAREQLALSRFTTMIRRSDRNISKVMQQLQLQSQGGVGVGVNASGLPLPALMGGGGGSLVPSQHSSLDTPFSSSSSCGEIDLDCVVCLDRPKSHLILSCMHLCLCDECASEWQQQKGRNQTYNHCPICSKPIQQIARIYV